MRFDLFGFTYLERWYNSYNNALQTMSFYLFMYKYIQLYKYVICLSYINRYQYVLGMGHDYRIFEYSI